MREIFGDNLPPNFFEEDISYTSVPDEADLVILPNNFSFHTPEASNYITKYADIADGLNIPLYIFSCGDYSDSLVFDPRATVFRYSLYKSSIRPLDVSTPTLTADISIGGISLRSKVDVPTVSFCGRAGFSSFREMLATWVRRVRYECLGLIKPPERARIRGILWRQWAIAACMRSPLVKTLFILRKTFSGALQTIEVSPVQARADFLHSMKDTDFVLAPKGDGNYSNRFLEALAMGRIPVLIDTDVVLPFEETIDYSKIMVRVPMNRIKDTPKYIREFYDPLTQEEWEAKQRLARKTYEQYLRQDSFFRKFFSQ